MQVFAAKFGQFGDPLSNERAVRIELFALADGIEHPEIRRGVGAGGGRPLPAAVVAGKVVVDEVLGKKPFAPPPIHQQMFGEELRGHHAKSVVHPAGGHQAALGGVHQRVAGSSLAPGLEFILVVAPFDRFGRKIKGSVHAHPGEVKEDVAVKVAPHQFADPRVEAFGFVRVGCQSAEGVGVGGTWRQGAQGKGHAQSAGARDGREVALGFVLGASFGEKGIQPRQCFFFIQVKSPEFDGGAGAFDGVRDAADGLAGFGLLCWSETRHQIAFGGQLLEHRAFVGREDLVRTTGSGLHRVGGQKGLRVVGVHPFASVFKRQADGFVAFAFVDFVFKTMVQAIHADFFGQCQQRAWGARKGVGVHGVQWDAQFVQLNPKRLGAPAQQSELVGANAVLAPRLGRQHHHGVHGAFSRRRGQQRGVVGGT